MDFKSMVIYLSTLNKENNKQLHNWSFEPATSPVLSLLPHPHPPHPSPLPPPSPHPSLPLLLSPLPPSNRLQQRLEAQALQDLLQPPVALRKGLDPSGVRRSFGAERSEGSARCVFLGRFLRHQKPCACFGCGDFLGGHTMLGD